MLIERVHPQMLRAKDMPDALIREKNWQSGTLQRQLEKHLHRTALDRQFFLHLSKEEQRKRFLGRIDQPDKN